MTRNNLQEVTGNLEGSEVILDVNMHSYSAQLPKGRYYLMTGRRIIGFRNPDFILILNADCYWRTKTEPVLLSPEDYKEKHQGFLREIDEYGFTRDEEGSRISVLQGLVDKECEIFERVMSNYSVVSSN